MLPHHCMPPYGLHSGPRSSCEWQGCYCVVVVVATIMVQHGSVSWLGYMAAADNVVLLQGRACMACTIMACSVPKQGLIIASQSAIGVVAPCVPYCGNQALRWNLLSEHPLLHSGLPNNASHTEVRCCMECMGCHDGDWGMGGRHCIGCQGP